ncbi:MAG: hypothetical protein IT581_17755 [Verrucomicrobiales bacterium]|nr:hypothetical protein [Verrucomicrobiales bacterium]
MKPPHHRPPPDRPSDDAADPEGLEAFLATQRLRQPPADWREAILRQATSSASTSETSAETSPSRVNGQHHRWGDPHRTTPSLPWLQRLVIRLTSGWSLTAAAWVLAFTLNQYSIPSDAFKPTPAPPPFSEAALAEIRESQRALGDFANLGVAFPPDLGPAKPQRAPSDAAAPVSPALPPEHRPRARLPRGFREDYFARPNTTDPLQTESFV